MHALILREVLLPLSVQISVIQQCAGSYTTCNVCTSQHRDPACDSGGARRLLITPVSGGCGAHSRVVDRAVQLDGSHNY
jgi:hypothetical protein